MADFELGEERPIQTVPPPSARGPVEELPGMFVDRSTQTVTSPREPETGVYREGLLAEDIPRPITAPGGTFPAVNEPEHITADRPIAPPPLPRSSGTAGMALKGLDWELGEERPILPSAHPEGVDEKFNTILTPEEESAFQVWKQKNAPHDSGDDYDLRGAFKAGLQPAENGHWSDQFKKPNHQTFSNESRYAPYGRPGHWENGDTYVPPKSGKETRGIRNNNPGNIEMGDNPWQGEVKGDDKRFATFDTPESGIRALALQLKIKQDKHQFNTVQSIIGSFAPPSDNNTRAYVAKVAKDLGVTANQPLNMSDPETLRKFTESVIEHENGYNPYPKNLIDRGVASALGATSPSSAPAPVAKAPAIKPTGKRIERDPAIADPRDILLSARKQAAIQETLDRQLTPAGVGETALTGFTYLLSAAPAAVAGLMTAIDQKDPQAFTSAFNEAHEAWTSQPHTASGKHLTHAVGEAFGLLGKVGDFLADTVLDPNVASHSIEQETGGEPNRAPRQSLPSDPAVAAMFKAAPELLGLLPALEAGRAGPQEPPKPPPARIEPTLGLPRVQRRLVQGETPAEAPAEVSAPPVEVSAKAPTPEEQAQFEADMAAGKLDPKTGEPIEVSPDATTQATEATPGATEEVPGDTDVLVYHGTQARPGTELKPTTQGQFGPGIYTTTSEQEAGRYSTATSQVGNTPNVMPLHMSLKNPLVVTADVASGEPRNWFKKYGFNSAGDPTNTKIVAELKAKGHDGIIATQPEVLGANADGSPKLGKETTHYVAFSSEQVKHPGSRVAPEAAQDDLHQRYTDFLDAAGQRRLMEDHGQAILDDLTEEEISPAAISKQFWGDTYFKLPPEVQARFQKLLKGSTGLKPGDVTHSSRDGNHIRADSWLDVADALDLPSMAEYLEGTDRGFVVLMHEANQRFGDRSHGAEQPAPDLPALELRTEAPRLKQWKEAAATNDPHEAPSTEQFANDDNSFTTRRARQLLIEEEREMKQMDDEMKALRMERGIRDIRKHLSWFESIGHQVEKARALEDIAWQIPGGNDISWALRRVDEMWGHVMKFAEKSETGGPHKPMDGPLNHVEVLNYFAKEADQVAAAINGYLAEVQAKRATLDRRGKHQRALADEIDKVLGNVTPLKKRKSRPAVVDDKLSEALQKKNLPDTPENMDDLALIHEARSIDEEAFRRIPVNLSDAEYMAAIRAIIDGK